MNFLKKAACIGLALATIGCAGCVSPTETDGKTYTVQYSDSVETYEISVTQGEPYSILHHPEKTWYVFSGLYDQQTGGTQYVDENGNSVAPYSAGKDMVLYPRFTPQEFNVNLDYQGGASVTGGSIISVAYGEQFSGLPTDVTADHKVFTGWYTKSNKGGVKVGDGTVFNENNFSLSATSISLYAGYDLAQYEVTLRFGNGIDDEIITVPYDTPVTEMCYETRNGSDEGVLTWSKTEGGKKYTGKITGATTLYATEWAPVIELDSDGGTKLAPVVARAGDDIELPKPERELYKFTGWKYDDGTEANIIKMPEGGASLTAKWQGKIVFDSNGGTDVDDLSLAAGTALNLPAPAKTGYVFANWYDEDGEVFSAKVMPVKGVKLKAGWYKAKFETVTVDKINSAYNNIGVEQGPSPNWMKTFDLSQYVSETGATIDLKITYNVYVDDFSNTDFANVRKFGIYVYDQPMANSAYLLHKNVVTTSKKMNGRDSVSYEATVTLSGNKMYFMYYAHAVSGRTNSRVCAEKLTVTISYPDTSELYL